MPLNLSTKFTDNIYILHCDGAITLGPEATSLEALLERSSHATAKIILNLANVHRLDSMGLGLIVRHMAALRKRNGDLRLSAPSTFVASLLDHTMLSTVLRSYPTDADALASFQKSTTTAKPQANSGRRILLIDSSPDLCAFVRTILSQHGFDIHSISHPPRRQNPPPIPVRRLHPHRPQQPPHHLRHPPPNPRHLRPQNTPRRLAPDFKTTNAHEAAETLLTLFGFSA